MTNAIIFLAYLGLAVWTTENMPWFVTVAVAFALYAAGKHTVIYMRQLIDRQGALRETAGFPE